MSTLAWCRPEQVSGDKISASRNLVQPSEETAPAGQRRANANHFPAHLFRNWRQLKSRLRTAKACALFLDLDGTLVPLRPRPADVQLARQTKRILKLLQGHTNLHLAFVSGRQLKVLRSIIGMDQVSYVGLHGAECEGKSLDMSRESVRALSAAKRAAKARREQEKIDAILEKVSARGMHSLTWWEKRTLRKGTETRRRQGGGDRD